MLVLDPFSGIVLANFLSAIIAVIVLARTYRDARWRTAASLLIGVAIGVPLGALVVYALSPDVLLILVGALTSLAVLLVFAQKPMPFLRSRSGPVIAGTVSAFSNVTAGVGGPALAMYGASVRLPMASFIPTVQIVTLVTNILALIAKPGASIPLPLLFAAIGCVFLGLLGGAVLLRFVTPQRAQRLALILALIGSLAATVRGIIEILN